MNPYATHLPVLFACLQHTDGPVLEMGAGLYSTPLINAFATSERICRTVEANSRWFRQLMEPLLSVGNTYHQLIYSDYAKAPIEDQHWGVVYIDHAPVRRRRLDIERLAERCDLLIAHDSDEPAYRYGRAFSKFPHRYDFTRLVPNTSVVSHNPLKWLSEVLSLS